MSIKCGKAWLEVTECQKAKDVFLKAQEDIKLLLQSTKQSSDLSGL